MWVGEYELQPNRFRRLGYAGGGGRREILGPFQCSYFERKSWGVSK